MELRGGGITKNYFRKIMNRYNLDARAAKVERESAKREVIIRHSTVSVRKWNTANE